jgi:hypothetical protein
MMTFAWYIGVPVSFLLCFSSHSALPHDMVSWRRSVCIIGVLLIHGV